MFKRMPFRCGLGFHSWENKDGEKRCKLCEDLYTPKKCRLGFYSKHTWETNPKSGIKSCKFCGKLYEIWKEGQS